LTSEKVRFGIVGCGAIGPTHAAALLQIADARLVAVADVETARAADLAGRSGDPSVYGGEDGYARLLADPTVDAVCVCTPSGLHGDHAAAALEAGKHVLVEKPMEISLPACDRMIAAADAMGKKLAVVSQHRFDPGTLQLKAALDEGRLGRIVLAEARVHWYRTQQYYDSGAWRGTWDLDGGGALMNQGIHTVDLLQWLVGGVRSLSGAIRIAAAHERIEVEDVAVAALDFVNDAVGTLTATTAAYDGYPVRIDIFGTDGSATLEGDVLQRLLLKSGESFTAGEDAAAAHAVSVARGGTASVKHEAAERAATPAPAAGTAWGDSHRAQIEDFIAAIRTDGAPLIDGRAGRKPVEIILGVYRSARSGQAVTIQ
jgi:predicted dehydrogenase